MQRQCAWFGCSTIATATYTFESSTCTVWLDPPLDGAARAGDLCDRHARSLKPPRGWHVEDRRRVEDRRVIALEDPAPELALVSDGPVSDSPGPDLGAELRTMLDAHTPLLARAFRSSGAG